MKYLFSGEESEIQAEHIRQEFMLMSPLLKESEGYLPRLSRRWHFYDVTQIKYDNFFSP